jgi:hypothetical protein
MNPPPTITHVLTCNTHVFDLNVRPCLMGILNVTPDSFSDSGRFYDQRLAIEHGLKLAREKTGHSRYFINRQALLDPEAYISRLIQSELGAAPAQDPK